MGRETIAAIQHASEQELKTSSMATLKGRGKLRENKNNVRTKRPSGDSGG